MAQSIIQPSFAAGEIAPSMQSRVDLPKYHVGLALARNAFVNYQGGLSSRPGTAYVGKTRQAYGTPPRLVPFQFSQQQTYILEFGDSYIRFITNGAYILETPKNVTNMTNANPGVFTSAGHGFSNGDIIQSNNNFPAPSVLYDRTFVVANATTNTFTLIDLWGVPFNTTSIGIYGGTGMTFARYYTLLNSPYAAADLPYLKFTQSADVLTMCNLNNSNAASPPDSYPVYQLERMGDTDWVLSTQQFASTIVPPVALSASPSNNTPPPLAAFSYVVTALNTATGEESIASNIVTCQSVDISSTAGSITITWSPTVPTAGQPTVPDAYNIYKAPIGFNTTGTPIGSIYGYIGQTTGLQFVDGNINPNLSQTPPLHNNPFAPGSITSGAITNGGGTGYLQNTTATINTSTGSGAVPVVVVVAGVVQNLIFLDGGKNYLGTDTVTINGGGGATGYFAFTYYAQLAQNDTITLNGTTWTFVQPPVAAADQSLCMSTETGLDLSTALVNLAANLNSSTDAQVSLCEYSVSVTATGYQLNIINKTPGTGGNSFTLAISLASGGGTRSGATLSGGAASGGATASFTVGAQTGVAPGVTTYFQQRQYYFQTLNNPGGIFATQVGAYNNMDTSNPVRDTDAIVDTVTEQQVNGIQSAVAMPTGLVMLTGLGAWQLTGTGGPGTPVTPNSADAAPQAFNGCHWHLQPLVINFDILFVQAKGSIIRDLQYNFWINIYTGTDITIISNHLFNGHQILYWDWAEEPYKLGYVVRDDGQMLMLTYLKEQEVTAWTHYDTYGLYLDVCSITEFVTSPAGLEVGVNAAYCIAQRYINNQWVYYVERFDDRLWNSVEDVFALDAALQTAPTYPAATLSLSAASGNGVTLTASTSVFTGSNVGNVVRVGGGNLVVTGYTSPTVLTGNFNTPMTAVLPDTPGGGATVPVPQAAGTWSVWEQVTQLDNLYHLEGASVTVLADGNVQGPYTVTNGTVNLLPIPASKITAGFGFQAQAQTLPLDAGNPTIQGKRKNISAVTCRVVNARGLKVGSTFNSLVEWKQPGNFNNNDPNVPLATGDIRTVLDSNMQESGQMCFQQDYPLPFTVTGVIPELTSGDQGGQGQR